jgi:hypothetical protein
MWLSHDDYTVSRYMLVLFFYIELVLLAYATHTSAFAEISVAYAATGDLAVKTNTLNVPSSFFIRRLMEHVERGGGGLANDLLLLPLKLRSGAARLADSQIMVYGSVNAELSTATTKRE